MTKKENIEKEVKNVKAKVAEVKEKDALDLAVDTMELEKKVEKKAKAVKAKVAEVKDKDALDLTVDAVELEKKVEKKAKAVKAKIEKKAEVFIQSPMGGEIRPAMSIRSMSAWIRISFTGSRATKPARSISGNEVCDSNSSLPDKKVKNICKPFGRSTIPKGFMLYSVMLI